MEFNKAHTGDMDVRVATERILNRMTDPREIEKRERKRKEAKRVETIRDKHSL